MTDEDDPFEAPPRPRDRKIDEAKELIFEKYFAEGKELYYGRQLEIGMETPFFHWITKRALNELHGEGRIGFNQEALEHHTAHFYYPKRHRYPRRLTRPTPPSPANCYSPSRPSYRRQDG